MTHRPAENRLPPPPEPFAKSLLVIFVAGLAVGLVLSWGFA